MHGLTLLFLALFPVSTGTYLIAHYNYSHVAQTDCDIKRDKALNNIANDLDKLFSHKGERK